MITPVEEIKVKDIIDTDDPKKTVLKAKQLANKLKENSSKDSTEAKEASKTQIRKLFATLRQIQMTWQQDPDGGYRELVMFGPRMVYQTEKHPGLVPLVEAIQEGIEAVNNDQKKLQRLVDLFEAVVAYYVAKWEETI